MPPRHVVVDGSNIATEGRSLPSLAQLDEAVQEFQQGFPGAEITVVVDASFGHRIEEGERAMFEEAEAHGEVVSPPAGAIGRGDAFLLLIAERTGAMVLSNDSFQEFHGEHEWLFDKDRLMGGKPVPGVGWIFTPRTPVRGPKSREAVKEARRTRVRIGSKEASRPMPVPKVPPPGRAAVLVESQAGLEANGPALAPARPVGRGTARRAAGGVVTGVKKAAGREADRLRKAIEAATKEVEAPDSSSARRRRRRRGSEPPATAVNEPLAFITFIADHPLGSAVEGEVDSFTSHGAFVDVGEVKGYVPLSGLGDPPPTKARSVLARGERRTFVLQALDPQRRGVELALPDFAQVTGAPSEETVKAEIAGTTEVQPEPAPAPAKRTRKKAAAPPVDEAVPQPAPAEAGEPAPPAPAKRTRKKAAAPPAESVPEAQPEPTAIEAVPELPAPAKRTRKKKAVAPPADQVTGEEQERASPSTARRGRPRTSSGT